MNRRRVITAGIIGSVLAGLAAVVGLAAHFAEPRRDDTDE
jgi:hypothetical protein